MIVFFIEVDFGCLYNCTLHAKSLLSTSQNYLRFPRYNACNACSLSYTSLNTRILLKFQLWELLSGYSRRILADKKIARIDIQTIYNPISYEKPISLGQRMYQLF